MPLYRRFVLEVGGGRPTGKGQTGLGSMRWRTRRCCVDVLTDEQVSERLDDVPGWSRQGDSIVHVQTLADFRAAVLYVGAVAYLAEAANHHPDIMIEWSKVTLTLSTHSAGGLTVNDFALAEQINRLS
jgi:4a-hydroxytetrahydrobiopterin dehydratase